MTIDKQALRADAVRAGGVKWQYMRATQHSKAYITDETGSTVINCTDGDVPAKCAGFLTSANPSTVLALLDELEAAEKRNTELVHNHRVHAARLINERGQLKQRIAELEAQSVTHDVGVMNIGNQYCEDFLVAWTVSGKSLPPGIYYLDARHAGDIPAGIGKGE
ncbi:TPA: ead/Ea22-like family protein [Citrobacter sedlakii]|nr:ead/Ea22-like family protein [Citrobacter sedlakii]